MNFQFQGMPGMPPGFFPFQGMPGAPPGFFQFPGAPPQPTPQPPPQTEKIPKDALLILTLQDNTRVQGIRMQNQHGDLAVKIGEEIYPVFGDYLMKKNGRPLCLYPSWEKKS